MAVRSCALISTGLADSGSDFLLFIPASAPNLHAVMSYYNAALKVNAEGDVLVSDDTIHGLGTSQRFLRFFFGSLFMVAKTPPYGYTSEYVPLDMASAPTSASSQPLPPRFDDWEIDSPQTEPQAGLLMTFGTMLIGCVPNPGYFVAGGIAGIVSRTSTAPLDRLKVYLIAQTKVKNEVVAAAKSGNIFKSAARTWEPLVVAMKELWHAGGMRGHRPGWASLGTGACRGTAESPGNGLNVIKVMPESAIKFGAYEVRVSSICRTMPNLSRLQNAPLRSLRVRATRQTSTHGPSLLLVELRV